MEKIKENSVVQVNEKGNEWAGCICQVDVVKSWGVQAYIKIPMQGEAYIRLIWDQIDYIGEAVLIQNKEMKM